MMHISKVSVCNDPGKYNQIAADFICNRFDLIKSADFVLLKWQKSSEEYYVQCAFENDKAELGIWLAPITTEIIKDVSRFIFKKYKYIKTVEYRFGTVPFAKYHQTNHFRIELPGAAEQLYARMTQKSRYNLRRSKRLLEEESGEVLLEEYTSQNVPEEYIEFFLEQKKRSFQFEFDSPPSQYLQSHGITDIYVMKSRQQVLSILLSCEQCRIVYLENLAYDPSFSKYSPGQILYQHYLERLIEKGRKDLFLMGGDYEYKRRYGAIEDTVFFGVIFNRFREKWENIYKIRLRKKYKQFRHSLKVLLTKPIRSSGD